MVWSDRVYWLRPARPSGWAGRKHGFSDAWEAFAVEVTKNAFMRFYLYGRGRRRCALCLHPFGGDTVIHHVDYDHVCSFGRRLMQPTPREDRPDIVVDVPDCEACFLESRERFFSCADRLRLVHSDCNRLLRPQPLEQSERYGVSWELR